LGGAPNVVAEGDNSES